jgi:hypothetical protein
MLTVFGSTHICEETISRMKFVKSKFCPRLTSCITVYTYLPPIFQHIAFLSLKLRWNINILNLFKCRLFWGSEFISCLYFSAVKWNSKKTEAKCIYEYLVIVQLQTKIMHLNTCFTTNSVLHCYYFFQFQSFWRVLNSVFNKEWTGAYLSHFAPFSLL